MLVGMGRNVVAAERAGRNLALWSVFASAVLAIAKICVGIAAHSAAVVSDGLEATADVLSSGVVFIGLWLASRPPDDNHPYGHGRYETLASLAVGGILVLTGIGIAIHSGQTMSVVKPVRSFAIYPLIAGVVVKLGLAALKWKASKRLRSTSLLADAWHDVTDLLSTSVAIVAVTMSLVDPIGLHLADHAGSIIIGAIVVAVGIRLVLQTIEQLTDTMPGEERLKEIRAAALSVPGAINIEKCFARRTGFRYHVDLHLEVDPNLTVRESHDIAMQVKIRIKEDLDWVADVLVHVEPAPDFDVQAAPVSSGIHSQIS